MCALANAINATSRLSPYASAPAATLRACGGHQKLAGTQPGAGHIRPEKLCETQRRTLTSYTIHLITLLSLSTFRDREETFAGTPGKDRDAIRQIAVKGVGIGRDYRPSGATIDREFTRIDLAHLIPTCLHTNKRFGICRALTHSTYILKSVFNIITASHQAAAARDVRGEAITPASTATSSIQGGRLSMTPDDLLRQECTKNAPRIQVSDRPPPPAPLRADRPDFLSPCPICGGYPPPCGFGRSCER